VNKHEDIVNLQEADYEAYCVAVLSPRAQLVDFNVRLDNALNFSLLSFPLLYTAREFPYP